MPNRKRASHVLGHWPLLVLEADGVASLSLDAAHCGHLEWASGKAEILKKVPVSLMNATVLWPFLYLTPIKYQSMLILVNHFMLFTSDESWVVLQDNYFYL